MNATEEHLKLIFSALTDIGMSRANNEDVWGAVPEKGFFALADGMGGHKGGEVAAALAIDSLCQSVQAITHTDCTELVIELRHAIQKANKEIFQIGNADPSLQGMGTTLCCLYWTKKSVIYAHIGDSRVYRLRKGLLEQLTQDHSIYSKWKQVSGKEHCSKFPYKHVITRAVGTNEKVKPEISFSPHDPDDLYFLCSDGLSDILTLKEMEKMINSTKDLNLVCKLLIEEAKLKGGPDNMTLVIIQSMSQNAKNLFGQQLYDIGRS